MTQPVKLHILPPNHSGPIMQEPGAGPALQYPKFDYDMAGELSTTAMAYHQGVLYTNTSPDKWTAVDADRAAALGYGPSDPWPFPDRIETPRIAFNSVTDAMMSQQHQAQARRNKVNLLNVHIKPRFAASLEPIGVRIDDQLRPGAFAFDFYVFDSLTIGQLVNRIQTRLQ